MVPPELSSSPVCGENAPVDCFVDSTYTTKSSDHHTFTSKFMANSFKTSFNCDENISKNEQDIYKCKQAYIESNEQIHQCNAVINSELTANKKWIQLAGHEQSFFFSTCKPGIILKKNEQNESSAYTKLNDANDQIVEFIPKFYSIIKTDDGQFIELQDLLTLFDNRCNIIDLKMGCRTFLENDVSNIRARPDLYEKLIKIDSSAATSDEHRMKAITKLRYMTFRENLSSSSTLGFRIEGFRCKCNGMIKDFKYLRKEDDVKKVLKIFLPMNKELRVQLLKRLKLLKARFKESDFFKNHEVVGSSLLIIHDDQKIGVWMIDFGRTVELPKGVKINHEAKWNLGNHEDGYLTGLNNLIRIIKEIV